MSLQRSGRGTSRGAASARPSGRAAGGRAGGVFVQTPKSDIYVVLLGIALGAIVIGGIMLFAVWYKYDFKIKVSSLGAPTTTATAPLVA